MKVHLRDRQINNHLAEAGGQVLLLRADLQRRNTETAIRSL
uniref:Uncharacterized protein n=1 Tax=Arundo donax TaxID=35708 RepID=A0A0A9H0L6_ARUDO